VETIADKLNYLLTIKTQIKDAIVTKGVPVTVEPFDKYAEKILEITSSNVDLELIYNGNEIVIGRGLWDIIPSGGRTEGGIGGIGADDSDEDEENTSIYILPGEDDEDIPSTNIYIEIDWNIGEDDGLPKLTGNIPQFSQNILVALRTITKETWPTIDIINKPDEGTVKEWLEEIRAALNIITIIDVQTAQTPLTPVYEPINPTLPILLIL
jgi:hypothetical protein